MRVTTKVVFDIETMEELLRKSCDYLGPVEYCGGGPSQQQKDAAAATATNTEAQTAIAQNYNQRENDQYNQIKPYAFSRINNGLPFYKQLTDNAGGISAKAYAPVRAATLRGLSGMGSNLPSGFSTAALRDVDLGQASNFDSNLVNNEFANEQAKSEAARLITGQQQIANPVNAYGAANQGNNSIMQAPLQSPGYAGLVGGIGGSLINKIPF